MKLWIATGVLAASMVLGLSAAMAATFVVVTPTNTQGWSTADTRPGGEVNFVVDATAPRGVGALQLKTNLTTTAKAQYLHEANTPLADVTELSYYTRQITPPGLIADPAYQLIVFLNGGSAGFTTLVFEPYQNPAQGLIVNNVWQDWDVDAGLFWSTRTVTCSNGVVAGTPGGPAVYTLAAIKLMCPSALVAGFGVNIGTNNPGYDVYTDLVQFNDTIYDFEPYRVASSKDDCKDDGWMEARRADGSSFKNQGDCVQYANTGS
jgi:hypothetical protein